MIDRRLDRAGGDLGRIAEQATSVLDDRIVAERIADLQQDAALSWQDPAHLRTLGHTTVGELRYQGERKGWDASRTDTVGTGSARNGVIERIVGGERTVVYPKRRP